MNNLRLMAAFFLTLLTGCQLEKAQAFTGSNGFPVTLYLSKIGGGFLRKSDEFKLIAHNRSSKSVTVSREDLYLNGGVTVRGRWGYLEPMPRPLPEKSSLRFLILRPGEMVSTTFALDDVVSIEILRWQQYVLFQGGMRVWLKNGEPIWLKSNFIKIEE